MNRPQPDWTSVLITAGIATAATTAVVLFLGKRETGSAAAPLNATSHILWGDEAATHDEVDVKHTASGAVLNAGAMLSWATVQELMLGPWIRRGSRARSLLSGSVISALAYVVDYFVVPKRLTPGFEKRLSDKSLAATYAALALSLAAGSAIHPKS